MADRYARPARLVGELRPGFFAVRFRRPGIVVGAMIDHAPPLDPDTGEVLDRSWYWSATINGIPDPNPAPSPNERVWRVWHSWEREIDFDEYQWLVADRQWARQYAPELAEARSAEQRIDLASLPPRF